jgi:hypothetical protein
MFELARRRDFITQPQSCVKTAITAPWRSNLETGRLWSREKLDLHRIWTLPSSQFCCVIKIWIPSNS